MSECVYVGTLLLLLFKISIIVFVHACIIVKQSHSEDASRVSDSIRLRKTIKEQNPANCPMSKADKIKPNSSSIAACSALLTVESCSQFKYAYCMLSHT